MKSAEQIINELIEEFRDVPDLYSLKTKLIEAFAWHPIERADDFGLRIPPPGKRWGPRVIVMMNDAPMIAYWDPDEFQPDGRPVAYPSPYWRAISMKAGWSRKARVTHFIRPYAPHV